MLRHLIAYFRPTPAVDLSRVIRTDITRPRDMLPAHLQRAHAAYCDDVPAHIRHEWTGK